MSRRALSIGLGLAIAWTARTSADVPRRVQLEYERQAEADSCPDHTAIRTGVSARLGYDPFHEHAEDHVRATIGRAGRLLEARIELMDGQGHLKAQRRLISHQRDCAELASAVELAIAIAIDPVISAQKPVNEDVAADAGASPGAAGVKTSVKSAPVEAGAPAAAAAPGSPIATRLDLGLLGGVGAAPSFNLGLRLGATLQGNVASIGLEARADLPSAKALPVGKVTSQLLVASVVPCAHAGMVAGCLLITAGAQRVGGEGLAHARHATLPYLGLAVRLALALPVGTRTSLAFHGDVAAPLTESRLKVDDTVVWTSPTVAVLLGIGLAYRFP